MEEKSTIGKFFGVVIEPHTYLNLFYLMLSFPLGIAYFIFLITGISIGIGLSLIVVGVPILAMMVLAWWGLIFFERQLAHWLLDVNYSEVKFFAPDLTVLEQFVRFLKTDMTWKGLFFLLLKFPLGVAAFSIVFPLLILSFALLVAPFTYAYTELNLGFTLIDSSNEAWLVFFVGLLVLVLTLHLSNIIASLYGLFAKSLLSSRGHYKRAKKIKMPSIILEKKTKVKATKKAKRKTAKKRSTREATKTVTKKKTVKKTLKKKAAKKKTVKKKSVKSRK